MAIGLKEKKAVVRAPGEDVLPDVTTLLDGETLKAGQLVKCRGPGVDGDARIISPTLRVVGREDRSNHLAPAGLRSAIRAA